MQVKKEIIQLKAQGIELWTNQGKLHFKAGKEQLTEEVMAFLKTNKEALITVLEQEAQANTFPLTPIQSAYLLGSMNSFEYGGVSSHIYMELEYDHLDCERVKQVWTTLIERHEMLRTTIHRNGYQSVMDDIPNIEITFEDLMRKGAEDKERLQEIRRHLGHKIYAPESWPLFDISLSQRLHGTTMHISFDFFNCGLGKYLDFIKRI